MIEIAPSILSADFSKLGEDIKAAERGGAGLIHVDVMDGHFVPNITIGPLVVKAARQATDLPLDCHLMITDPDLYIDDFARSEEHTSELQSRSDLVCRLLLEKKKKKKKTKTQKRYNTITVTKDNY